MAFVLEPRHRPAEETLPYAGQAPRYVVSYSLKATPLNDATPGALAVAI